MLGNVGPIGRAVRTSPVLLVISGLLASCAASDGPAQAPPSPAAVVVADAAEGEQSGPEPRAGTSPLSGLPAEAGRPVIVVKLDNTRQAQPHIGLRAADVVYVEEVEWGLTRLAAVFSSRIPESVGPIRSARITDIDLLAPYGHPAFAYSGAQKKLLPELKRSALLDVSPYRSGTDYDYDPTRRSPYDIVARPSQLLRVAGDRVSPARDIGFVFSDEVPGGGADAARLTASWPDSSVQFRFDAEDGTYAVHFDGRPAGAAEGGGQHAATVVVQYVRQTDSRYRDRFGGRTPLAHTVGEGSALVLRDGRRYEATWSRPAASDGTRFTRPDGTALPFKPGQQWVLLVDEDRAVEVR